MIANPNGNINELINDIISNPDKLKQIMLDMNLTE